MINLYFLTILLNSLIVKFILLNFNERQLNEDTLKCDIKSIFTVNSQQINVSKL